VALAPLVEPAVASLPETPAVDPNVEARIADEEEPLA
jgi:hypothetical protein